MFAIHAILAINKLIITIAILQKVCRTLLRNLLGVSPRPRLCSWAKTSSGTNCPGSVRDWQGRRLLQWCDSNWGTKLQTQQLLCFHPQEELLRMRSLHWCRRCSTQQVSSIESSKSSIIDTEKITVKSWFFCLFSPKKSRILRPKIHNFGSLRAPDSLPRPPHLI